MTAVTVSRDAKRKLCAASRCEHYTVTEVIEFTVEYAANRVNWPQGDTRVITGRKNDR